MEILSWNIRWGCGCDNRVDFDRIAQVIRAHGLPDVLCLQEIAVNQPGLTGSRGEDQVNELQVRLPEYSAHYAVSSDLPDDSGGRRLFGNLVMSRLPVLQVYRHALPYPADPACPSMPRVAIEAVVQARIAPIRITTTHLEYYSLVQRQAQFQGLRCIHEEAAAHARHPRPDHDADPPFKSQPRPLSSVYCGDFNCAPDAPEFQDLLAPFAAGVPALHDAWSVAHPGSPHEHTVGLHGCDWPDYPYCCDYFVVSDDLVPRVSGLLVDQGTAASDHQPILLSLTDT